MRGDFKAEEGAEESNLTRLEAREGEADAGRQRRGGLPRRLRKEDEAADFREATSTMACCDLREDEERVASSRRETSSSRKRESAKTAGEDSTERFETSLK